MTEKTKSDKITANYLKTLEEVKQQYKQYVEVSKLYELPTQEEETVQYLPPSAERPLTTNKLVNNRCTKDGGEIC